MTPTMTPTMPRSRMTHQLSDRSSRRARAMAMTISFVCSADLCESAGLWVELDRREVNRGGVAGKLPGAPGRGCVNGKRPWIVRVERDRLDRDDGPGRGDRWNWRQHREGW